MSVEPVLVPRLVGFSGYPGSGKDTAADILDSIYHGVNKISFADPMREMASRIDPIVGNDNWGARLTYNEAIARYGYQAAKNRYPDMRRFLQRLGTEAGRDMFGVDHWVKMAMKRISAKGCNVITDVRFPNEADAVRNLGGLLIRLERDGCKPNMHAAERSMENYDFDYRLTNNSGVGFLAEKLAWIFDQEEGWVRKAHFQPSVDEYTTIVLEKPEWRNELTITTTDAARIEDSAAAAIQRELDSILEEGNK